MEYLRGQDWVRASELSGGTKLIDGLLAKGWIERQTDVDGSSSYRITELGLAVKKAKVPISG